jgi:NADH-quinone oxidoreductase subunit J
MTALQILFGVVAFVTLGAALMVVSARNLVHSGLWLILALFGVAVLFVLLDAGFLAVAQVVIYIGAIAILLIFAIMLTRRVAQDTGPQVNPNWGWAALISLVVMGSLAYMLVSWPGVHTQLPALAVGADPLRQLGEALVSPNGYVLPFEVASVLLVAALIGALLVAWERK